MKRAVISGLLLLTLVGAACAESAPTGNGGTDPAAPVPPPTLEFTIADQGVTNIPPEITAGINELSVTNEGKEKRFPAIALINEGVKRQKVGLSLVDQDFETFFTSAVIAGVLFPEGKTTLAPGKTATLITELPEGTYIMADPDEKRFEPGYFEVGPASGEEVATPEAAYEIVESEYAIELPAELPAGSNTFSLTNAGEQGHELVISEKTKVEKSVGYAMAPAPGATSWVTFNFEPGKYTLACYLPAVTDGKMGKKNHFDLGMKADLTVK